MQESLINRQMEAVCYAGFIDKGTGKHQSNQVLMTNGLSPTLYAVMWKEPFKIVE